MNKEPKRYIFIDYENLKKIKVKKLRTVCDKFYILINDSNKTIPFSLVTKMQKLGDGVKWIAVDTAGTQNLNYHIVFLLGKLHNKLDSSVEFIVISNDKEMDPLLTFINDQGRYCIRVRRNNKSMKGSGSAKEKDKGEENNSPGYSPGLLGEEERKRRLIQMIEESKKRLVIVDTRNRPEAVPDLCEFLTLHNQEMALLFDMNEIVHEMEKLKDIQVVGGQVIYNF